MGEAAPGEGPEPGRWSAARARYRCADGREIAFPPPECGHFSYPAGDAEVPVRGPRSGLVCRAGHRRRRRAMLAVSGALANRIVSDVLRSTGATKTFAFPRSARAAGAEAFRDRKALQSVRLGPKTKTLGAGCFQDTGLRRAVFPQGATKVAERMFMNCFSLREAVLPKGLEALGEDCFAGCGLARVSVPAGVREI